MATAFFCFASKPVEGLKVAGGINTGAAFGIGCYFTTVGSPLKGRSSGAAPLQVASKADAYTERWEEWEGPCHGAQTALLL